MRGRKPKPDALKALSGGSSHRPDDGRRQLDMPEGTPEPPAHLSPGASQEWFRTVRWLMQVHGLLSPTDHAAIGIYCSYYDQWQRAEEQLPQLLARLDELDDSLERRMGTRQRDDLQRRRGRALARYNSALGERNKARREMRAYLSELGLTPAARTRIRVDNGQLKLPGLGATDEDELARARRQLGGA